MERFEAIIGVNFWTALFVLLNTLTIFLVGKKFLFGPVMKMIRDRQEEIDGMYAKASDTQAQAMDLQNQYQEKMEKAAQAATELVQEAVARGQHREEQILREAQAQAVRLKQQAAEEIAQEKKKALNDAKDEISDLAMAIAGKVIGRSLDTQDQSRLVEDFINELGEEV